MRLVLEVAIKNECLKVWPIADNLDMNVLNRYFLMPCSITQSSSKAGSAIVKNSL
jgi:hypothetical protein